MFCNKYLEEFKIDLVKQYFSGRPNKDICDDYKIARSTLWGWICKYGHMCTSQEKVDRALSIFLNPPSYSAAAACPSFLAPSRLP